MNAGGAETFLMKIYRTIDRSKYQMDFCVNLKDNYYSQEISQLGGKIFVIPSRSQSIKEHNKQLSCVIREGKYKYVMAISSNTTCYLDMLIAKKSGASRCIVRSSNSSNGTGFKELLIHKTLQIFLSKYIDVMISPSDLAAKFLFGSKALKQGKIHYLHNAINYDLFKFNASYRETIRKENSIADDCILVGHVGRFNTQKNHEKLIDIFKFYHQRNPNSKLMLIGIGNLQEEIRKKVKELDLEDSVLFTGLRNDVNKMLSAMDVFVLPSFFEGMPNVVIEAQANGLPCVISDTITREANITGLVKYVSLNSSDCIWSDVVEESIQNREFNTFEKFKHAGYLIEDVAKEFVNCIFEL